MSKIVTLRLSEDEYKQIALTAKSEHRPISNFIAYVVLKSIDESQHTDSIETSQIRSDKNLLLRLKTGHEQARKMKGRFV